MTRQIIKKYADIVLKNKFQKQITSYPDLFNLQLIDLKLMETVSENISNFLETIKIYKNILLISMDYPDYGGAATNCKDLQDFLLKNNHLVFSVFFSNDIEPKKKHLFWNISNEKELSSLEFVPDLVILKSFLPFDIRKYFKKPIYYCIGGIYLNSLDKYYYLLTKKEHDKFVNRRVLQQIQRSDKVFVNSKHTFDILKKFHNIQAEIFYSSFVKFYKTNLNIHCENYRTFEYGYIVSNFKDRTIKNINNIIDYLKTKENVILIGKNASIYNMYSNFTCLELVPNSEMSHYYSQIKYILHDSFYESCSNVRIEALFHGCKIQRLPDNKSFKKEKIVVSSTQYPGYGGSATNAYAIIKYLRNQGHDCVGIFFHNMLNVNYDPDDIGGIYLYLYNPKLETNSEIAIQIKDTAINYLNGKPTICFGKNYAAPVFCKKIFNCFTIYLVSGINHNNIYYPTLSAEEMLDPDFKITKIIPDEIKCNELSDVIVFNSLLSFQLFQKIYPSFSSKFFPYIVDTTKILSVPKFSPVVKEYDILICCSNLERVTKNNLFLITILENPIFSKYKKCIIGENFEKFKNLKNCNFTGLLSHEQCINYMNKSKTLLFPSLFDANSNTVREATIHNCIPLISKNIGFYELFPAYCVCDKFDAQVWKEKLHYILVNYNVLIKNFNVEFTNTNNFEILLK